ncbi:trichohyalin-like [Littorina saxatilis]|uniref:trichohyalin-like n=1 Tax=Littorina saxatilis TaxID=31220 RepID=UPI0038B60CE0
MSANVSLVNNGVSINFDAQDLQNQQEAEIEREEQMQQNELRQLLSNAFDDLDDDLSIASSEDDSVNHSHISSQHDSFSALPASIDRHSHSADSSNGRATSLATTAVLASKPGSGPNGSQTGHHAHSWPAHRSHTDQNHSSAQSLLKDHTGDSKGQASVERVTLGARWQENNSVGPAFREVSERPQHDTSVAMWQGLGSEQGRVPGYGDVVDHPQHDYVDGGQHSQSQGGQYSAAPAFPYSIPSSSQPSSAPAYSDAQLSYPPPTSADQYWTHPAHNPTHYRHDSQPSDNNPHPHPHPYTPFMYAETDSFGTQQGETPSQDQYHFQDYGGEPAPASHQEAFSNFAHDWNTNEGAGVSAQQGFAVPSHPENVQLANNRVGPHPGYPQNTAHHDWTKTAGTADSSQGTEYRGGVYPGYHGNAAEQDWSQVRSSVESLQGVESGHPRYPPASGGRWDGEERSGGKSTGENGGGQVRRDRSAAGDREEEDTDHYTVKYRKLAPSVQPAVTSAGSELKVNFITQEGDTEDTAQLSQLQMLYRARGRQLEDLRSEMDALTQESAKERRRLKHLLSVATGEKEGMESSLKQCQQLLQQVKDEQSKTESQRHSAQTQITALTESKEELLKKLQSAETTVENLSHQVAGLHGTDSLTHARHQHEAVIKTMQQRFDSQLLNLKQQLDAANDSIAGRTEEVSKLQSQVRQLTKMTEEAQISRGATINQLTRSLEESQQRCQALLAASSNDETGKLRAQLQQSLMSKNMSDDMCNSLQTEVQELKEQLNMLESAASLGAISSSHPSAFTDDSISDLGIRKTLDFSTPESTARFDGSHSSEELVSKLRRELERCVASNRAKRSQVSELQQQTKRLQQEATETQQQLREAQRSLQTQQVKVTSYEERLGGSMQPSVVEARLKRDIENMQVEKLAMLNDLEDYKTRLNEVSASEEQVTQMNSDLKRQIAAMVTQHDHDKQQAVERCRKTCEDIHRSAREKMEHAIRSELFADKQELIMTYEQQVASTREKLREAEEELDKVKDMYVETSRQLTQQEEALRDRDQEIKETLAQEKKKWEEERQAAMESEWQQRLAKERSKWESQSQVDSQERWQERLETERKKWESERQASAEKDWLERLEAERTKWESERDVDWEKKLAGERKLWESEKQPEAENDWQERLEKERSKWESERRSDLESQWQERVETERKTWEAAEQSRQEAEWQKRLEKEKRAWESEKRATMEAEWAERSEKERLSWQVGADRDALDQVDMAVEHARRQWQQETQQQLKQVTAELEECRQQHKAQLAAMESKWQREVAQKEAELERGVEQHLRQALETELEAKLTEQRTALLEQAAETLQRELSQQEKQHTEKLKRRLSEEVERVRVEVRRLMEQDKTAAVEAARILWQTQQRQVSDSTVQESSKWKEEALQLKADLNKQKETWHREKTRLLTEKDEERRQAVASVRAECQADYERFMSESKATLDTALDSARQRHQQELGELESRYKEELAALRAVEQELRQAATETSTTTAGSSSSQNTASTKDLARQVEKLKKEVEKRDVLLRQADEHMEQEVERLKDSLADSYTRQREKDNLRLQAQYSKALQLAHKERTRLERQLEQLAHQLNTEKKQGAESPQDMDSLVEQLQRLEAEREQLRQEAEEAESGRQRAELQQEEVRHKLQHLQKEHSGLAERLEKAEGALRAVAAEKEKVARQQQQQMAGLQQRCDHSKARVVQLEAALRAVNQQHREDVDRLRDSLRDTHRSDMATLSAQLAQAQKQHAIEVEELTSEHKAEQRALVEEMERRHQADMHTMMEDMRGQMHRALANTPTQTDTDDSLCNIKDHYFTTVQKIRDEVMSHVSMSNERAATSLKGEIRLERLRVTQHLRRRCKTRLHQIFKTHTERSVEKGVWPLVDHALDCLFDSVSSSCSATPNTSAPVTPRSSGDPTPNTSAALTPRSSEDDTGRILRDSEGEGPTPGGRVNLSGPSSTPQSQGSERYSLPSALAGVDLESNSSQDLQASGVFYSLQIDDTASVTDSETEFRQPLPPVRKAKHVGFQTTKPETGKKRRSTPPKIKSNLSVFVNKDEGKKRSSSSSLLPPRLHTEGDGSEQEEGVGSESGGWKEVDGEGWVEAVGGTNLWQAYEDLRSMELEEKDATRRKLSFASKSFLDNFADSDGSSAASEGKGHGGGQRKKASLRHAELSRSVDFTVQGLLVNQHSSKAGSLAQGSKTDSSATRHHSLERSPQPVRGDKARSLKSSSYSVSKDSNPSHKNRSDNLSVEPHRETQRHSSQPDSHAAKRDRSVDSILHHGNHFHGSYLSSHGVSRDRPVLSDHHGHSAPHHDRHYSAPASTLPAKLLLNPKNFLSKSSAQKTSSSAHHQEAAPEGETLDTMLARLGIKGDHSRSHRSHSTPAKKDKSSRLSDSFLSSATHYQADAESEASPGVGKTKSRTRSAEGLIPSSDVPTRGQHRSGKHAHSSVHTPQLSSQAPVFTGSHSRRVGREAEVLQRSLEDLKGTRPHPSLSHATKAKSRSEQALNVLSEAFGEGDGQESYRYTPLKQFLPPPSPSTSLLSTHSVSEGDLSHLPKHLAWDRQVF